jgi:RHS repeat-associated protein
VSSSTGVTTTDNNEPPSGTNFSATTNRLSINGSTYDNAGNQTYYAPYTLTYDAENRLTLVEIEAADQAAFAYDGDGRRVTRWLAGGSGTTTYFIYDIAGRLAAEYSDGEPGDSGRSWVFTDMLGSVRAVTDDAGAVTECYDYLPFGWMLTEDENGRDGVGCYPDSPTSYTSEVGEKFTGQIREPVDLDYFIARYYSAGQGRFAGPDFLSGWREDVQSWNRYSYARNNPNKYIDPSGLRYIVCDYYQGCGQQFELLDLEFEWWLLVNNYTLGQGEVLRRGEPVYLYFWDGPDETTPLDDIIPDDSIIEYTGFDVALFINEIYASARSLFSDILRATVKPRTTLHLPDNARIFHSSDDAFRHLQRNHGIEPRLASERLHKIKADHGLGGRDVLIDRTGNVYHPVSKELLGSLTQGGAR